MGYFVAPLPRPYDYHVLIEVFIRSRRTTFAHADFQNYYKGLLAALEAQFGFRMSDVDLSFNQRVLWGLFNNTLRSLLEVGTPWDWYLEASLLHRKIEESGEPDREVMAATERIFQATSASTAAHYEMLDALFRAIFGTVDRVVTSEELAVAGFDDSQEPQFSDYLDEL